MDRDEVLGWFAAGAAGSQLCREAAILSDAEDEIATQKLRWLPLSQLGLPRSLDLLKDDLADGTSVRIQQDFAQFSVDHKMGLWGRIMFRVDESIDPEQGPVTEVPGVRSVLRSLAEADPIFPVYLDPGCWQDWGACVVDMPQTGSRREQAAQFYSNTIAAIRDAALGIAQAGIDTAQNTGLIAERLTSKMVNDLGVALSAFEEDSPDFSD
jgi:hypothetical protein